MTELSINLERLEDAISVFGSFDENIRLIEHELGVSVVSRDSQLKVSGEDPEQVMYAVKAIENLMALAARGEPIQEQNVRYVLQLVRTGQEEQVQHLAADVLCITAKGKPIKAKTLGQKKYIDAIKKNVVTLGVGPAGTGKTYLAVAAAVASDSADAGMGILSAANAMDLDFIEIASEEYDFAVPERFLELSQVKAFIEIIKSDEFKKRLEEMGGYDTEGSGSIKRG